MNLGFLMNSLAKASRLDQDDLIDDLVGTVGEQLVSAHMQGRRIDPLDALPMMANAIRIPDKFQEPLKTLLNGYADRIRANIGSVPQDPGQRKAWFKNLLRASMGEGGKNVSETTTLTELFGILTLGERTALIAYIKSLNTTGDAKGDQLIAKAMEIEVSLRSLRGALSVEDEAIRKQLLAQILKIPQPKKKSGFVAFVDKHTGFDLTQPDKALEKLAGSVSFEKTTRGWQEFASDKQREIADMHARDLQRQANAPGFFADVLEDVCAFGRSLKTVFARRR